jgi:hypothetical protein
MIVSGRGNSFQALATLTTIEEQLETTDLEINQLIDENRQLTDKLGVLETEARSYINECVVYEKMIQQIRNSSRTAELRRSALGAQLTRAKIESQLMKTRVWSNDDWDFINDEDLPYFAECAIKAAEYDLQMELELAKDIMMGVVV